MKKLFPITVISMMAMGTLPALAHGDGWTDHFFKQADTNGDGMISKDEYTAYSNKKFDEIDTNHDGMLSKKEVADHMKFEKSKMKKYHANMDNDTGGSNKPDDTSANDSRPDTSREAKSNSESSDNH